MQLQDITYDILKQEVPRQIIFAPNSDDSARGIRDERDWNDWKEETLKRWGNVEIEFTPEDKVEQIKILDDQFIEYRNKFIKIKSDYFAQSGDDLDEAEGKNTNSAYDVYKKYTIERWDKLAGLK